MKHTRFWRRMAIGGVVAGLAFSLAGDRAQTQVPVEGIDPLEILNLEIKPNVLIIQDTSGSMRFPNDVDYSMGGDDPAGRMYQAKDALTQVLNAAGTDFNFGFASYGEMNSTKIVSRVAPVHPSQPSNFNAYLGPFLYVSVDAEADSYTGGGTDFFIPQITTTAFADWDENTSLELFQNFLPYGRLQAGPFCAAGTPCRRLLFARALRDRVIYQWDLTAGSAGLQAGFPQVLASCPLPPVDPANGPLFPLDPNVDADPTRTDLARPCIQMQSTAGNTATFYYTSMNWEFTAGSCAAAARLANVAPCSQNNVPTILGFLKPELPLSDGTNCPAQGVGKPCFLTPAVGAAAPTNIVNTNPATAAGANANTALGIIAAQATPLGAVLDDVGANFATYFPSYQAGQNNYAILITDGDESCGGNAPAAALTLYNSTPRVETFVIGFGPSVTTLNQIARNGSGGVRDAFFAADTPALVAALQSILQQSIVAGEFAPQPTAIELVFEFGAGARDPNTRYNLANTIAVRLQSTFEMPGFRGHLNAIDQNAVQVWDAASKLCVQVTGQGAGTGQPPQCNGAAPPTSTLATGTLGPGVTATFAQLVGTGHAAPRYTPGANSMIRRRIFTTTRNGIFPYAAQVTTTGGAGEPSDNGPTVPIWPPTLTTPVGVDPAQSGSSYPQGLLDVALGLVGPGIDFTYLRNTYGACRAITGDPVPADCGVTTGTPPRQEQIARKEAREMILAFTAGAQVVRAVVGNNPALPDRDGSGNLRYQARPWILGDSTLATPGLMTVPPQPGPPIHLSEYVLYRDGRRNATGTPVNAISYGFGLRNPDIDNNAATSPVSIADLTLKPNMSVAFYPGNDMLHAFRAGPQCVNTPGPVPPAVTCLAGIETGGEELWGFVPYDQLYKLSRIMLEGQDRSNHKYVIAASVRFGDVFVPVPGGFSHSVGGVTLAGAGKWRTLVFVGRGIGGSHYTALDTTVSGAFASTKALQAYPPFVLWNRGYPDTVDGSLTGALNSATVNPAVDSGVTDWVPGPLPSGDPPGGAYASMGQTWSVPALTRVDPATNFSREFVLYTGSGYSGTSTRGHTFYSIDPVTGDVLTATDVQGDAGSAIPNNAIVANPAAFLPAAMVPTFIGNFSTQLATRVYVGDVHGRVWKFLTAAPATNIQFRALGVDQPVANGVALLNYNSDAVALKPHVFVEAGNDRRVPAPQASPPVFKLYGLRDDVILDNDTTAGSFLLFTHDFPSGFRGTTQPATAFRSNGDGRVFFAGTKFNPLTGTNCRSSFDSVIFAVTAATGGAAYDLDSSGGLSAADISRTLTGQRVSGVQIGQGRLMVDTGLNAENAPPPPAPPPPVAPGAGNNQVLVQRGNPGSAVCK